MGFLRLMHVGLWVMIENCVSSLLSSGGDAWVSFTGWNGRSYYFVFIAIESIAHYESSKRRSYLLWICINMWVLLASKSSYFFISCNILIRVVMTMSRVFLSDLKTGKCSSRYEHVFVILDGLLRLIGFVFYRSMSVYSSSILISVRWRAPWVTIKIVSWWHSNWKSNFFFCFLSSSWFLRIVWLFKLQ